MGSISIDVITLKDLSMINSDVRLCNPRQNHNLYVMKHQQCNASYSSMAKLSCLSCESRKKVKYHPAMGGKHVIETHAWCFVWDAETHGTAMKTQLGLIFPPRHMRLWGYYGNSVGNPCFVALFYSYHAKSMSPCASRGTESHTHMQTHKRIAIIVCIKFSTHEITTHVLNSQPNIFIQPSYEITHWLFKLVEYFLYI